MSKKAPKSIKNPYAQALANRLFCKRIVRARKGKGAYIRKEKHPKNG